MTRVELIEALDTIDGHINHYKNALLQEPPYWWCTFWTNAEWEKRQEINKRCLGFWQRKFNRILNELKIDESSIIYREERV